MTIFVIFLDNAIHVIWFGVCFSASSVVIGCLSRVYSVLLSDWTTLGRNLMWLLKL